MSVCRRGQVEQAQVELGDDVLNVTQPRQISAVTARVFQHQQSRHRLLQR
jgi:hypothetical protein